MMSVLLGFVLSQSQMYLNSGVFNCESLHPVELSLVLFYRCFFRYIEYRYIES